MQAADKTTETGKVGFSNPPMDTRWKPGVSPNPGGKPVRARNKINARFLNDLLKEWETTGARALKECSKKDPATFIRVVASLQPKEIEIIKPLEDIPDEQLDAAVLAVRAILAAQNSGSDESRPGQAQHPSPLQALPETT